MTTFSNFLTALHDLLPITQQWSISAASLDSDVIEKALIHYNVPYQWHWMDEPCLVELLNVHRQLSSSMTLMAHCPNQTITTSVVEDALFDFHDMIILGGDRVVTAYHVEAKYLSLTIPRIAPHLIRFYSVEGAFGAFSNFSLHPVRLNGKMWPTSEHFFQAQKFAGTIYEEKIRRASTPMEAAKMGRNRKWPLRPDWESVKRHLMYRALEAKFTQHAQLNLLLLQTGDAKLVEHTAHDRYWGDGGDGTGQNWLGRLLVQLRTALATNTHQ